MLITMTKLYYFPDVFQKLFNHSIIAVKQTLINLRLNVSSLDDLMKKKIVLSLRSMMDFGWWIV